MGKIQIFYEPDWRYISHNNKRFVLLSEEKNLIF